jgi:hypothetical protein
MRWHSYWQQTWQCPGRITGCPRDPQTPPAGYCRRELEADNQPEDHRLGILEGSDPAERLLELKICDPAMGSGHFLVSLVDYLSDRVITAMAEAQALVTFIDYVSPLIARIAAIRRTILRNAEETASTISRSMRGLSFASAASTRFPRYFDR